MWNRGGVVMRFGPDVTGDWQKGTAEEWLVTNGLGGYAAGTICGVNTRRYHGLLINSTPDEGGRRLFVSKLHEELTVDGHTYYLAANELADGARQHGYIHLVEFTLDPFPTFVYRVEDIYLIKEIFMVQGEATTIVCYRLEANRPCKVRIYPLVNDRSHHEVNNSITRPFEKQVQGSVAQVRLTDGPIITMASTLGIFHETQDWFYNMCYPREQERGEEYLEHHLLPGYWEMEVESSTEFAVSLSLHGARTDSYQELYLTEKARRKQLAAGVHSRKELQVELARAADPFLVKNHGEPGIIAGYPWFDEWGRDTFISLPGLLLVNGRFSEAKQILAKYARLERNGLLPNMIADHGETLYNTADASLWYFQAVKNYLDYTGDLTFIRDEIYPVLKKIIYHYRIGTDYHIAMDTDGLISAGEEGVQLTWMDAKVGDWVVTPRHGKAVEINALWYNALYFMTLLAGCCGQNKEREQYGELALLVKEKFAATFWSVRHDFLADTVCQGRRDERLRPNQLFAVSLPYRLLTKRQEKQVVDTVGRNLYTPFGLRTLASTEKEYHPQYIGDRYNRDAAYHQGTAWAWLVGPYITAYRRVHNNSRASRRVAQRILSPFFHHLFHFGLGSIAEIFDGDHPFTPRGCPFQAWSVAELLRAYVEDVLENRPDSKWVCEIIN